MLQVLTMTLIGLCALEHLWFLVLEMFLWQRPIGLRIFGNTADKARDSVVLAKNMGLYNGFLAVGLIYGLLVTDAAVAHAFRFYFLMCMVVAGVYGGMTVSSRVMYVQGMPPALAMVLLYLIEPH